MHPRARQDAAPAAFLPDPLPRRLSLYHGSDHVIERPVLGAGRPHNDFGRGFYCTPDIDLAREWASVHEADGFANRYELDTDGLSVLRLDGPGYCVLHWIAVLVRNRPFRLRNPVAARALRYLDDNFPVSVQASEIVVGWRADDSYYDFADGFLNNAMTVQQLAAALRLGGLGLQVALVGPAAFGPKRLHFLGADPVPRAPYAVRRKSRDDAARAAYERILMEADENGLYVSDIMRERIRHGDPRLP